jgi:hypothetical protein
MLSPAAIQRISGAYQLNPKAPRVAANPAKNAGQAVRSSEPPGIGPNGPLVRRTGVARRLLRVSPEGAFCVACGTPFRVTVGEC